MSTENGPQLGPQAPDIKARTITGPHASTVAVLESKFVSGVGATRQVQQLELPDALTRPWSSDAHFQACYAPSRKHRRLTSYDVGRFAIFMTALVFDVDAPGHTATPEWRSGLRAKISKLFTTRPGFYYETRGGARLVWRLQGQFPVATPADAAIWRARYLAACEMLRRAHAITADTACGDWQRLFRLPFVQRDGVMTAPAVIGDTAAIGVFELPPVALSITSPSAASERSERQAAISTASHAPSKPVERGSLFDLLNARGDILGRGSQPGSWRIRCPRSHLHTTGFDGDGSTLLYEATVFAGPGAIFCCHSHCSHIRSAREWRKAIAISDELRGFELRGPQGRDGVVIQERVA